MHPSSVDLLLVEDRAEDAELCIRVLRQRNLATQLVHVWDGAEALDFLFGTGKYAERDTQRRPRVIFLDLKLPKIDGIEVLRRLRADSRSEAIPVVIMSSSREEQDIVRSYKLGANSYIVKPVDFEQFSSVVSDLGKYWLLVNEASQ